MSKRQLFMLLLPLAYLMIVSLNVQAATIATSAFNQTTYNQGETGYLTVTVYNDFEVKIRITELTATIDYYYTDGTVYLQQFFTDTTVPAEIQPNQSANFTIPFSLPTNIAPGYTNLFVKAKTELWYNHTARWYASDHPTYQPTLYVESPYKKLYEDEQGLNDQLQQLYEDQQALNDQLQQQYRELQDLNATTTNMMYLLALTTIAFVVLAALLVGLNRKARVLPRSTA
jgi:hypothetical protein